MDYDKRAAGSVRLWFHFWKSQANPRQTSARRSKLTTSKNSPQPVGSGHRRTAAVSANKHNFLSDKDAILGNDSANKATKALDGDGQTNLAGNVIIFTRSKAPPSHLKAKVTSKVSLALERARKLPDREGGLYTQVGIKTTSLVQEVSEMGASRINGPSEMGASRINGPSEMGASRINGPSEMGASRINESSQTGVVRINGPSQIGAVKINGPSEIGAVKINGPSQIGASRINGPSEIGAVRINGPSQIGAFRNQGPSEIGDVRINEPSQTGASRINGPSQISASRISGPSDALRTKRGRCECNKRNTEVTGSERYKFPATAIDKFREINCFRTSECQDSVSASQNYEETNVKGYETQSYSQADNIRNEATVNDVILMSDKHVEEQFSQISNEDETNAIHISLKDELYVPVQKNSFKTADQASHGHRYFQDQRNFKSGSINSDSVISANEAAVDLISQKLRSICRKYGSIQQDNSSNDSRMVASTRCPQPKEHLPYYELSGSKTNSKPPHKTSRGSEVADHRDQIEATRLHPVSFNRESSSVSDDHSWSFTRRNSVFEDRYASFMKISSFSKRRGGDVRRTIQLEPRPSKKLIVQRSKYEKLRFNSQQWPDEMLHGKNRAPKLACLLLHPDDYLLEHGRKIGAQKVYTKDGFKFIVPLTFVSYGNKMKRVRPVSEEPTDDLGFSLSNISASADSHGLDDVSSVNIRQTVELGDISNEENFKGTSRKSGLRVSVNTCGSLSHLSSMGVEDVEEECGLINCYHNQEISRTVKKKLPCVTSFAFRVENDETTRAESVTPVLQIANSSGQTNETKFKEITRSCGIPACWGCLDSEDMDINDVTPDLNEIIRKGSRRKATEPGLKPGAGAESMKNVSKWLSDVRSCRSRHSDCSSSTHFDLKWPENLATTQSTGAHSCSHKDYTSESGSWHRPLQEHEYDHQLNYHPLVNKCTTSGKLQSHLTSNRLKINAKNAAGHKGVSSHSNSTLSLAYTPTKHGTVMSMTGHKSDFKANDETQFPREEHCMYDSESVSGLEKDQQGLSRKNIFNNEGIRHSCYRQYLNVDDTEVDRKKLERFQRLIKKLAAKRDCFPCKYFHTGKRSHTDSTGNVSALGSSVPFSYKSLGKLASTSPAFAHMPLFHNRQTESVNIVVRLESSAQKNLIEKHANGSLMSASGGEGGSCLLGDSDECCLLGKTRLTSETSVTNSATRRLVKHSNLIFGNKDIPLNVFAGQKQWNEVAQMKQQKKPKFDGTADGNGHRQFQLHCAVLATDDRGKLRVKKFEGNMQEEDTMFVNDFSECKDQTNLIKDLTNLDLNSDPSSLKLLMKRANTKSKPTTSATEAGNADVNLIYKTKTEHNPTYEMVYESKRINLHQLSTKMCKDSSRCSEITEKDEILNTNVSTKCPHTDKKHAQHHMQYRDRPPDHAKNVDPSIKAKTVCTTRSNHSGKGLIHYKLQKQESTVQNEGWDRTKEQESMLLGKGDLKVAASTSYKMNTIGQGKITTENRSKTCCVDSTRVTTSGHAIKHLESSRRLPSEHAATEITEDFTSFLQFPRNDNGKQANTARNNKRAGLVKQTFSDISEHLSQTTYPKDQDPQQKRNANLLNEATARRGETIPEVTAHTMSTNIDPCLIEATARRGETIPEVTAHTMSTNIDPFLIEATARHGEALPKVTAQTMSTNIDPCLTDRKPLSTVPREESAETNAVKNLLNKHLPRSCKLQHPAETSLYKGVPKRRSTLQTDDASLKRSRKNKTNRAQKQLVNPSENTDAKEINRCGTSTANLEQMCFSSVFKDYNSQKERCAEKINVINITNSKVSISNGPHLCNSSEISQESEHFSKQKQTLRSICDKETTLQAINHMDHKRCQDRKLFPRKSGLFSHRMHKCKTLPKTPQKPNKQLLNPNEQVQETSDCSPTLKQTLEKPKHKPEGPSDETNKSVKINNRTASPQFPRKISKRHFSKHKGDMTLFSESVIADKRNQSSSKSVCKMSGFSEHSLTCNADNTTKIDIRQSKLKNSTKVNRTNKQLPIHTKDVENMPEMTSKLNSKSSIRASMSRHLQDSIVRHQSPYPPISDQADWLTSAIDADPKSTTKYQLRKPRNLQHILFKKMFKFCAGEDKTCDSEHQPDSTAGLETPHTRPLKEFKDRIKSGKPRHAWIQKQSSEVLKLEKLRENKTGYNDQALASKTLHFDSEDRAPVRVEESYYTTDTNTQEQLQTSCEGVKDPGFQTCADSILDDTEDCCLPDQLPGKIGGSTEASSADISNSGSPKLDQQLAIVEDVCPVDKQDNQKSTCHFNVDELREKYLKEMTQKGLFRNRTFDIKNEKNKVLDKNLKYSTLTGSTNRGTFSSDTTIIKSPLQSQNMADLTGIVFHTSDICCSSSTNNLKRKREDYRYEGLNAANKITSYDKSPLILSSDKCLSKHIHVKQFPKGSDFGRSKVMLTNNRIILRSPNGMSVKPARCENMKTCSLHLKSDVAMKKPSGSHENCRLYSPVNEAKPDNVQAEHNRDVTQLTGLCWKVEMSNSNSPSSTSANIPVMNHSDLTSQPLLSSAGRRIKHASDIHVSLPAEDNPSSTKENYQSYAGQQEDIQQSSTTKGSQQFASRRPSQIPKMKRSETSSSRIQRSETRSLSQIHPLPNENQRATSARNSQSSSYSKLETVSIKQQQIKEPHFICQSSKDSNKTPSEKIQHQNEVSMIRSPDSSTDVIISWFEKENANDPYQQDTDTELMSSLHNIRQSTASYSQSNYTLTTICGFQGETVPMANTPDELVGTAKTNKHPGVNRFITQATSDMNDRSDSKSQESREQVSDSMRQRRPFGNNLPENIPFENSNDVLTNSKEDSNKIPFWQKQLRSNSLKISYAGDRSGSGQKTTSVRAKESKDRLESSSQSERRSRKVESLVKAFDNKCPVGSREQTETSSRHQQEEEPKKPGLTNIALNSRLRIMRGLAKNRKYVSSALMYTIKKQNASLPHKPITDVKQQQHSMLKTPALSTNNSAVLDKADVYLKQQIPIDVREYNFKTEACNCFVERCQQPTTAHKNTTASKVYCTTSQNAVYFYSAYEPARKQMKVEVSTSKSSCGHSIEGDLQGATNPFNGKKPVVERIKRKHSIFPVTVPFCIQGGDARDTKHAKDSSQDAHNEQHKFEENNQEEDNKDDQIQGAKPKNCHSNGSACTTSDSLKMSFDWYKPSATSTARAVEHDQVLINENQGRSLSDQLRQESDSELESNQQEFVLSNTPATNRKLNYGPGSCEETIRTSQESLGFGSSWNWQGLMQANLQKSRCNIRSGVMLDNRKVSGEGTHEYKHTLAHDLAKPNMDTSNDVLFQKPSQILSSDSAANPQQYFHQARMNQPANNASSDIYKSQPSSSCPTSDAQPMMSESRCHYMPDIHQSCPRCYRRLENQFKHVPAEDASLSNLNALYEYLQQNYNQANAVYHSNWVLANQNSSLNDSKTIPGQFDCYANSKSNTGDTQHHLILKEHYLQTSRNLMRPYVCPYHESIASSNRIFHQKPLCNDQSLQFRHCITNNSVAGPAHVKNRIQNCFQNQHFLTGSNNLGLSSHQKMPVNTSKISPQTSELLITLNNQNLSSHQKMHVNVSRIFPRTPELSIPSKNLPNWQYIHHPFNIPNDQHNSEHVDPPTLPEPIFPQYQQPNRWRSGE